MQEITSQLDGRDDEDSEPDRTGPQDSAIFGAAPKDAEAVGTSSRGSDEANRHTLTVRQVAKMFEAAGVARTERSVVNWCRRDAHGFARLDSYYDVNERRHFITPESAGRAIEEELAKLKRDPGRAPRTDVERGVEARPLGADAAELQRAIRDLEISNRAKDLFIERLEEDRNYFVDERRALVERLESASRTVGRLEARLSLLPSEAGSRGATSVELAGGDPSKTEELL